MLRIPHSHQCRRTQILPCNSSAFLLSAISPCYLIQCKQINLFGLNKNKIIKMNTPDIYTVQKIKEQNQKKHRSVSVAFSVLSQGVCAFSSVRVETLPVCRCVWSHARNTHPRRSILLASFTCLVEKLEDGEVCVRVCERNNECQTWIL